MREKIIWILILCTAAMLGFYMGLGSDIKRMSNPQGAAPKYEISYGCRDAEPVHNKNDKIIGYFAQCLCFISDDTHEATFWDLESVNHLEFQAAHAADAKTLCESGCQDLCREKVGTALRENPNFKIPTRW